MVAVLRKLLVGLTSAVLVAGMSVLATGLVSAASASAANAAPAACYPVGTPKCPGQLGVSSHTVPQGGSVTVYGSGYKPGTKITIQVCTIETLTTTANSSGDFSLVVHIPSNAPCGPCTITSTGEGANGTTLVLSTAITITCVTVIPPVHTGEPWANWLYWALAGGAALLGFGLFEFGRRRRTAGVRASS